MSRYNLHYAPDNASLIIRLALEHLGQPYRTTLVNRAARQQSSPAYQKLNPHGLIPVIETPDGPIFETGAILLWLTDRHGEIGPNAASPRRADFIKWLFFVANTVHPALRMTFYPDKYVGPDADAQTDLHHTMQAALKRHLATLDACAANAPFDLATQFYIAPLLRWCALYPVQSDRNWFNLADTPHLHALCTAVETMPCALAAIQAEGLGPTPFTNPALATPPEGSAT